MQQKTIRFELRLSEKTKTQLEELQRILTTRIGTKITKTEAVEIAINRLLDQFIKNPEQARLI